MTTRGTYLLTSSWLGNIGMLALFWGIFTAPPGETAVTVQSFSGTVKMLLKDEGDWKPVAEKMPLQAGDEILTEKGGAVDLLGEDGSTLHLEEGTQLAISALEFSEPQKTRVSRFKLFWGKLTGKAAAKLAFTKNVFEVETDTVVAGFKFSSMTITADENTGTTIIPIEGKLEFKQLDGKTQVIYTSPNGVTTTYPLPANAQVTMDLTPDKPVEITSNLEIPNMHVTTADSQGNKAAVTLTIPKDATVGINKSEASGYLLTLTSNVAVKNIKAQTIASDGNEVNVTLTIPGATPTREVGRVDIGITGAGRMRLSGNADFPVTVQNTSNAGTINAVLIVPANEHVTIGQNAATGEITIGSNVPVQVTVGDQTITVNANSEIGISPADTRAAITVKQGTATVRTPDGKTETLNQGESTTITPAPEGASTSEKPATTTEPAPATEAQENPVVPSAPSESVPQEGTGSPIQPKQLTPTPRPK